MRKSHPPRPGCCRPRFRDAHRRCGALLIAVPLGDCFWRVLRKRAAAVSLASPRHETFAIDRSTRGLDDPELSRPEIALETNGLRPPLPRARGRNWIDRSLLGASDGRASKLSSLPGVES